MSSFAIIGSGFGGLSLAVRLQAAGHQVRIFEKRPKIGGRAYQLKDAGYTFDMGPSLVTAPSIVRAIFEAADRRLEDYVDLVPLDPFYRIFFHDGTHMDYNGDAEQMKSQLAVFSAKDAERYDDFMSDIKGIYDAVITEGLGKQPFDTIGKMARFVPRAMRLNALLPVARLAKSYFEDFRSRFMFSFHPLFIGGHPFRAPSIYAMIPYLERKEGVWFSKGGMYSIVEALGKVFEELGGQITTSAEVEKVIVKDGAAKGLQVDGSVFDFDGVISNGDVTQTYLALIDPQHRKKWTDRKLKAQTQSMSCFLMYIGTRKKFPELAHHTLILSERYKELIDEIFAHKELPEDFSMYLHVPTATDDSMAPEGCESMYVLIPVPNLRASTVWAEEKEEYADKVLDFLEEWGMSGLRDSMEVCHIFTPDDFESQLNATDGNAFALEPKLTQTAWFRPHNRSEDIDSLYVVGAGTHPGAGVPGVMLSSEATLSCILEDYPVGTSQTMSNKIDVESVA
ncbi:MAG: phytoene desaturase family protein [Bacteroidetes bacterium]|nr:phytoene desaturase family protein [Bacteroidota bacterium]